jgi:hypothetical protein
MSNGYQVQLGGVYSTEQVPGTGSDPSTPSTVNWLDPTYMIVGTNGHLNELRCRSNKNAVDFYAAVKPGTWIQIVSSGSGSGGPQTIFDGVVVNEHFVINGNTENTELVAFDHGTWLLHRIPVHGQYRRDHSLEQSYASSVGSSLLTVDPSQFVQIDTPCVFNPAGEPNATQQTFQFSGGGFAPTFPIFEKPFRDDVTTDGTPLQAQYWTLQSAVTYLLSVTNASWCIDPASFDPTALVEQFQNNPVVSNINCEGDSLLVALEKLLSPHNYLFWIDPALNTNGLHNINFVYRGAGPHVQLHLSSRGTAASHNQSNLIHCDLLIDNASTINYVESYGDRLNITTLAETNPTGSGSGTQLPLLVKGWADGDLTFPSPQSGETQPNWFDTTFRKSYCNPQLVTPPTGSATNGAYGVGRMWLINLGEDPAKNLEDLSLDLVPGNGSGSGGGSGSGSGINTSVTGANSIDPRRFERPELFTGNSLGGYLQQEEVVVELSTNSGTTWEIVDRSEYRIMPNGLAIIFTNPSLDFLGIDIATLDGSGSASGSGAGKGYWQALYDHTLQIRILCSIKSDERLHCTIQNDGSAFPLAIGAIANNYGYKRTIFNSAINNATYYVKYPPLQNNQDDTSQLETVTQTQLANTNRTQISGNAVVLMDGYGEYLPGDTVTGITNRAINFSTGNWPGPTIVHVTYKFDDQQVELHLDNHRTATLVKEKPISSAENLRQHKLGIENPTPLQGGHGGDYLPETTHNAENPSWQKWLETGGAF